jgi:hypothetical protein
MNRRRFLALMTGLVAAPALARSPEVEALHRAGIRLLTDPIVRQVGRFMVPPLPWPEHEVDGISRLTNRLHHQGHFVAYIRRWAAAESELMAALSGGPPPPVTAWRRMYDAARMVSMHVLYWEPIESRTFRWTGRGHRLAAERLARIAEETRSEWVMLRGGQFEYLGAGDEWLDGPDPEAVIDVASHAWILDHADLTSSLLYWLGTVRRDVAFRVRGALEGRRGSPAPAPAAPPAMDGATMRRLARGLGMEFADDGAPARLAATLPPGTRLALVLFPSSSLGGVFPLGDGFARLPDGTVAGLLV